MKKISILLLTGVFMFSCVSKKKYVALQEENGQIKSELAKTRVEKEDLEAKFDEIQARIDTYNSKISSLTEENDSKIVTVGDDLVISNDVREKMNETLKNVDAEALAGAKTLKDSMNLAVSYNLKKSMNTTEIDEDEDIAINIDETVVMISISDKMLFNTASYRVSNKADGILKKLADVINSEPSIEVMVEGHTDSRSISTAKVSDNWDLSVLRATSVVRKLQDDYGVAPEKMIASGRSFYQPIAENDSAENRSKNRRTNIIILPNINKFFALMGAETKELAASEK
ncbi:OmpA family protein [Mangrovimonas sp. AS39]|uniref:OmpA/MotB family protein n=1 Tax=Mangrovimonas TaxID=1211036 RepID=UPI0014206F23|nr:MULTISPECIES: OmpA family protein [Mangrovimonas]MCF1191754.1 OmpA family protein [Mangrovimonas futianensis]MCF1195358.1 OmpA family protein [Mangrovimonas futianensis]MCF1422034.1 OmpA family protein [Mangrovimonas futianensis]NIK91821.1 OmpA family protein [Mangrovimonas sp. CR14]